MAITKEKVVQEVKHSIWRTLSVLVVVLVFGGIGFAIYNITKKPSQNIIAEKGSNVQVTQINKTSRTFIPFIEGGFEQQSDSKWERILEEG